MREHALQLAVVVLFAAFLVVGVAPTSAGDPIENVTVYDANGAQFDDAESIEAAIKNGSIQPARRVLVETNVVVAIRSERLATELQDAESSKTDGLFEGLANGSVSLRQINSGSDVPAKYTRLSQSNATVYGNEMWTYIVLETPELEFYRGSGEYRVETTVDSGDAFVAAVEYESATPAKSQPFKLFETPAEVFAWDRFDPLPPAVVEWGVRINIPPTTAANATMRLEDGRTATTRIQPNESTGWDTIRFDLRNVANGTNYTMRVIHDGTVVNRLQGTVTTAKATLENVSVRNRTDGLAIRLDATLSHGGSVVLRNEYGWKIDEASVAGAGNKSSVAIHRDSLLTDELILVASLPDPASGYYRNPESRIRVFPDNETAVGDASPPPTPDPAPIPTTPSTPDPTKPPTDNRTDVPPPTATPGSTGALPLGLALLATVFGLVLAGLWRR